MCAGNLLGRPTPQQKIADHAPQSALRVQVGKGPTRNPTGLTGRLGGLESIAIGCRPIATKLTANGAGAAAKETGNGTLAPALLQKRSHRQPIFWLQVRVSRSHLCKLPEVQVLHFKLETAQLYMHLQQAK